MTMNTLERLNRVERALEDAQNCIMGETPEVGTREEAAQETLELVRKALLEDLPLVRKAAGWFERARS